MARGYPDFFGFSTFPCHGELIRQGELFPTIPNGATRTMQELTFKSVIAGGWFRIEDWGNLAWPIVQVILDGNEVYYETVGSDLEDQLRQGPNNVIIVHEYTVDKPSFAAHWRKDFSIGHQLQLNIGNATGADIDYSGGLWYSPIT